MNQQNYGVQVLNLDANWKNEGFNSTAEIKKQCIQLNALVFEI